MAAIVLVPGAWLGEWAWDRVRPILEAAGNSVYPVTPPGLGNRSGELSPALGLMSHVEDLAARCQMEDVRDAILLGHSYAGAVVGAVARRMPERFRAQVYLDTMPLDEGRNFIDGFSPEGKAKYEGALVTQKGTRVWPMPQPLGSQAPTDGLTSADLELLRAKGTPHPALTFEERLTGPVKPAPYPKSYAISCVEDEKAAAVEKEWFLKEHPDWVYYSLPICHWPMLSSPKELAAIINQISEGASST